jgi:hypothetical protein
MPSNILLNARTAFLAPQLRAQGFRVCEDPQELGLEPSLAVDLMQAHERPDPAELAALIQRHDRVVLINAETPLIIKELARDFDHAKVTFVTTGRMNWRFQHAQVVEFENFFAVMQRHYSDHWLLPELQALRPRAAKPRHFDALLGLVKPHRSYVYQQIQRHDVSKFWVTYNGSLHDFTPPIGAELNGKVVWTGQQVRYRGDPLMLNHIIPIDIYNQTAYSIVTETYTSNDFSFFTEKNRQVPPGPAFVHYVCGTALSAQSARSGIPDLWLRDRRKL